MQAADERGTGIFSAMFAVSASLMILFLVAQTLLTLHAESVVNAAVDDAARKAAFSSLNFDSSIRLAEQSAREQLGNLATHTQFDWSESDERTVVLTTTVERKSLLASFVPGADRAHLYRHAASFSREVVH